MQARTERTARSKQLGDAGPALHEGRLGAGMQTPAIQHDEAIRGSRGFRGHCRSRGEDLRGLRQGLASRNRGHPCATGSFRTSKRCIGRSPNTGQSDERMSSPGAVYTEVRVGGIDSTRPVMAKGNPLVGRKCSLTLAETRAALTRRMHHHDNITIDIGPNAQRKGLMQPGLTGSLLRKCQASPPRSSRCISGVSLQIAQCWPRRDW